jgi:hypothetical protein
LAVKLGTSDIRKSFMAFVRPHLNNKEKKYEAKKFTGLELGTLDGMIYDGRGGIEAWQKLLAYVFNISESDINHVLLEFKEFLGARIKMSPGELMWTKLGEQLTEDEKIFFCELAKAHKMLKPPFIIKQPKKKIKSSR